MESSKSHSKQNSFSSPLNTPFTKQFQYKQRAQLLFKKLANFQQSAENNKYNNHQRALNQIQKLEHTLSFNMTQKRNKYQKVLQQLNLIQSTIEEQKIDTERKLLHLEGCISNTSRQMEKLFEKVAKQRVDSEDRLRKAIDDRLEILLYKNKLLLSNPNEQSLINYESYSSEMNHIKSQIKSFYDKLKQSEDKLIKQFNSGIDQYKYFLKVELQESHHQQTIQCMKQLHIEINEKLEVMKKNRECLENNVLQMLEKIVENIKKE